MKRGPIILIGIGCCGFGGCAVLVFILISVMSRYFQVVTNLADDSVSENAPAKRSQSDKSEGRRHDIWNDYQRKIAGIEGRVQQKYPSATTDNRRRHAYEKHLIEAADRQFIREHNIGLSELTKIEAEAAKKDWAGSHAPKSEPVQEHR